MSKGLAAFVAGMGSGYLNAQQRARDQERQDKLDARGDDLHAARMDEINQANKLRMGLADAVAPRSAQAGTVLEGGQTKEFYQDPAQVTPQLQQDRQIEAEMRAEQGGQTAPAVQASQGYGTTGMGLGNQITAHRPDVDALNSPEAQTKRIGLAYGANGKPLEAMQYQAAARAAKEAEITAANKHMQRQIGEALMTSGKTRLSGLANLGTKFEQGPLAGMQFDDVKNGDGTVTFHAIGKDGKRTPTGWTFPDTEEGAIAAAYKFNQALSPELVFSDYAAKRKLETELGFKKTELDYKYGKDANLENLKSGNNIKETGVRLGGERSNAEHRIGLEQQAPVTLSEGQQRMVPQRQKDGSITYVTAASVPAKPNAANPTSARMLKLTIDTLGDTNRVSGQKIGNQKALDIATAAEMLVNGGMGELEAINKAAADLAIKGVK